MGFVHFPPLFKVYKLRPYLKMEFSVQVFMHIPLFSQDALEKEVEKSKAVNLELVFGYHWKPGTGNSVRL